MDYNKWTVVELKKEITKRNLSTKGLKADLVKILKEDDNKESGIKEIYNEKEKNNDNKKDTKKRPLSETKIEENENQTKIMKIDLFSPCGQGEDEEIEDDDGDDDEKKKREKEKTDFPCIKHKPLESIDGVHTYVWRRHGTFLYLDGAEIYIQVKNNLGVFDLNGVFKRQYAFKDRVQYVTRNQDKIYAVTNGYMGEAEVYTIEENTTHHVMGLDLEPHSSCHFTIDCHLLVYHESRPNLLRIVDLKEQKIVAKKKLDGYDAFHNLLADGKTIFVQFRASIYQFYGDVLAYDYKLNELWKVKCAALQAQDENNVYLIKDTITANSIVQVDKHSAKHLVAFENNGWGNAVKGDLLIGSCPFTCYNIKTKKQVWSFTMNPGADKIAITEEGNKIIVGCQQQYTGLLDVSPAALRKAKSLKWKSPPLTP